MEADTIELFAGAGGLALGLELAGFRTRALVERDRFCCETLQHNASKYFPDARILRKDVRGLSVTELLQVIDVSPSEIDLVAAGPPCQSFSISKIPKGGRSPRDPRDGLLQDFVRFVKRIKPTLFLFENVPGLLSKTRGRVFKDLLKSLHRLGYATSYDVLNAADYGVPQIRRRLFVLGSLDGGDLVFPSPSHGPPGNGSHLPPYQTIGEALPRLRADLPNQRLPKNTEEKKRMLARIRPGSEWKHWRHRDRWDRPSRCITAHCRDDWIHPREPRAATVRELAALQTFPDDYEFLGPFNAPNNADFQFQYRQVGNSVPVLMAKAIGESLQEHLFRSQRATHRQRKAASHSRRATALVR
jgi:DNA (cytosine-5)-methyltransferase 1